VPLGLPPYPGWTKRDWDYHHEHLAWLKQQEDELKAWRTVHLPPLLEAEKRRLPLHPDLQREFLAYGHRNIWIYLQVQLRSIKEVAAMLGISRGRVQQIAKQTEKRLIWRAARVPFERHSRSRPIDMGGPRDVWLEFNAPIPLRTPDPRLEDWG